MNEIISTLICSALICSLEKIKSEAKLKGGIRKRY